MSHEEMRKMQEESASNCRRAEDAMRRACDGIDGDALSAVGIVYALKQLALAMGWASAARDKLERVVAYQGACLAEEMARSRIADQAYTPSVHEVLRNPSGFMDGFREVAKEEPDVFLE